VTAGNVGGRDRAQIAHKMATKRTRRPRRSWGKIRQLPNKSARHQASYVGPDLARHCAAATFTTRMDAERWLSDERRLIEREQWTPPKLRAAARHAKAKTLADYPGRWIWPSSG
jgi:hypothetical protein